jgi:hypothetical protein
MTLFGKILVVVNLVFSLVLFGWAFGVYTQRIDWSNKKGTKGPEDRGELAKRQETYNELWRALDPAEKRQKLAAGTLGNLEGERNVDRPLHKQRLEQLRTLATDMDPAQSASIQDGKVVMAPADFKDRDNKGPRSLAYYERELTVKSGLINDEMTAFENLVKQDNDLLNQLVGEKGLRERLFREVRVKQARIVAEQEALQPVLTRTLVESDDLLRRQRQLQERVAELTGVEDAGKR